MIVVGLQMDLVWENPQENFERARSLGRAAMVSAVGEAGPPERHGEIGAADDGGERAESPVRPDLLVLPEMFATGFSMNAVSNAAFAEETRAFLRELAAGLSVHVLGGYAEPTEDRPANACSIFDPAGTEVLHYRKLHPFSLANEDRHYRPGDALETVEVAGVRVTPLICYDLRFPEPFRAAARDTDLFCVPANWPSKRSYPWSTLLRARAIENQAFVLGVNRVGMGGGEPHSGDSALLDPLGMEAGAFLPRSSGDGTDSGEGLIVGEVDPRQVGETRRRFGFLDDARPELYRRLEEERGRTS